MISERSRNFIVGLTILLALAVSMYGIILLGKVPGGTISRSYMVAVLAPTANGVVPGAKVELNGVYAGQVNNVYLSGDADGNVFARVDLVINQNIDIPSNAEVKLDRPLSGVGNSSVQITAKTREGVLAKDGSATLNAAASEGGLIPQNVLDDVAVVRDVIRDKFGPAAENIGIAAKEISVIAKDLHVMLAYTTPEEIAAGNPNDPNRPRENASSTVIRLSRAVDNINKLLADPQVTQNLRNALQNIADASAQLKTTMQKIDAEVGNAGTAISNIGTAAGSINTAAASAATLLQHTDQNINRVSLQLVTTLGELEKTVRQIAEGKGTTGLLINDPRLFNSILDLSRSLKSTTDDLNLLVNKWKDEGLNLNLK